MKCQNCGEEMWITCRRDSEGFMNELYYKCLACGYTPTESAPKIISKKPQTKREFKVHGLKWKVISAAIVTILAAASVMQIPVPVRVLATEIPLEPLKDVLPYIQLVNFTISKFTLNYTEGEMLLEVSADYATMTTTETAKNITTCKILLGRIILNYKDSQRKLQMGFASLIMTVNINYPELIAHIDLTTYMPLWTAIMQKIFGNTP